MSKQLLDRVCVVWRNSERDTELQTLIFRPERLVRTYEPDRIDGRCGTPPVVTDRDEALKRLRTAFGSTNSIAIPVRLARSLFGWKNNEFYDPAP